MTDVSTVTEGGYTVTSTSESADQIRASIAPDAKPSEKSEPDISEAAAALGKKGGEAAAEARAAKAKEQAKSEREAAKEAKADAALGTDDGAGEEAASRVDDKPLGKPRDDPRARMLEATRQAAEAKRERDQIRAEKDKLAVELAQARAPKPAEAPKPAAGEPKPADFEDYGDYVKAAAKYAAEEIVKDHARQASERQQTQRVEHDIHEWKSKFSERMGKASEADPAFTEKLSPEILSLKPVYNALMDREPITAANIIADEIVSSGHAPALMLHLSEHPDELQRLKALPTQVDVQVEMRLIAKSLSAAPTATVPKLEVSQANPPLRPVKGSPHTAASVPDSDDASYEEHKRYWTAKERRAR